MEPSRAIPCLVRGTRLVQTWAFLPLLFGTLSGFACNYHIVRYGDLPEDVRSISVRTLENDSTEPGVELLVTEALRREIMRRGGIRLVADPSVADLVLRGRVRPLAISSKSFSSVVLVLEYTVTLAVDLEIERRGGTTLEFSGSRFRNSEIYLASADVEAGRKNREEALRRVAGVIAERVHDALEQEIRP